MENAIARTSTASGGPITWSNGTLSIDGREVLTGLDPSRCQVTTTPDAVGGAWLAPTTDRPAASFIEIPLGRIARLRRFTSSHRRGPFWLKAHQGASESDVKTGTLWVLAETGDEEYLLMVALLCSNGSYFLDSQGTEVLAVGDTGDARVPLGDGPAVHVARGRDPYELLARTARVVARHTHPECEPVRATAPDFVDLFGWCTWDAFYHSVSPEKVREGLRSWAQIGLSPRLVILDDGWQSVTRTNSGEEALDALQPNAKFNHDLTPVVREAKANYGVRRFLVWHALLGYWGGVSPEALPDYRPRWIARNYGPGVLAALPYANVRNWGRWIGVPATDAAGHFFDDYHRLLAAQGVDGVKVDNQAALEGVSEGQGGRVATARAFRAALERSVNQHFAGRLINCMSCSPEHLYLSRSGVTRTSDDFWPNRPETHGGHVYLNAHTSLWFGHFTVPDWDMFQSLHPYGAFHAAARAISGGPVYVSDQPGKHDPVVLRPLVLADGTVLRADGPGRLTRDCLFVDPTRDPVLLKIFNTNGDCGVLGVFNAHPPGGEPQTMISGSVGPADIPSLTASHYAGYAFRRQRLWHCSRDSMSPWSLAPGEWEVISFAPVQRGVAVIGLAEKLNSTGALVMMRWVDDCQCEIELKESGLLLAWSEHAPKRVSSDGVDVPFHHHAETRRLTVPPTRSTRLMLSWPRPDA